MASSIAMTVNEFCANAVKHTPDTGARIIAVHGIASGDDYRLICTDGGPGLADLTGLRQPGRGLGLRIIAASCASHGAIPAWSNSPAGLTLTIDFKGVLGSA